MFYLSVGKYLILSLRCVNFIELLPIFFRSYLLYLYIVYTVYNYVSLICLIRFLSPRRSAD